MINVRSHSTDLLPSTMANCTPATNRGLQFGYQKSKKTEGKFKTALNYTKSLGEIMSTFVKKRVMGGELSALTEEGWHVCHRRTKQCWHCVYGLFLLQKNRHQGKKRGMGAALTNTMCSPVTEISTISSCQANQSNCLR